MYRRQSRQKHLRMIDPVSELHRCFGFREREREWMEFLFLNFLVSLLSIIRPVILVNQYPITDRASISLCSCTYEYHFHILIQPFSVSLSLSLFVAFLFYVNIVECSARNCSCSFFLFRPSVARIDSSISILIIHLDCQKDNDAHHRWNNRLSSFYSIWRPFELAFCRVMQNKDWFEKERKNFVSLFDFFWDCWIRLADQETNDGWSRHGDTLLRKEWWRSQTVVPFYRPGTNLFETNSDCREHGKRFNGLYQTIPSTAFVIAVPSGFPPDSSLDWNIHAVKYPFELSSAWWTIPAHSIDRNSMYTGACQTPSILPSRRRCSLRGRCTRWSSNAKRCVRSDSAATARWHQSVEYVYYLELQETTSNRLSDVLGSGQSDRYGR